jgi:gluconate transporter
MAADGPTLIALTLASVALLLALILVGKMHAFVALIVASMALGLTSGLEPVSVIGSIKGGMGDALGKIAIILALGAMIGRFLEHSGGGRVLADWFLEKFGKDRASWAVLTGAFIIGLPIFFDVAFIILAPIVWNLARESKKSILFYGLPVAAALTVTHALVAPHPAPAAAAAALGADLGKTIVYGILICIPMAVVGGIFYGTWIARRIFVPVPEIAESLADDGKDKKQDDLPPPSVPLVLFVLLLPIALIFAATIADMLDLPGRGFLLFLGDPATALTIALFVTIGTMGFGRGLDRNKVAKMSTQALGPIASLLLITGAGGSFKQVITDCGVGPYAGNLLAASGISPLVVAYLIAALLRVAQGSATVAIITAAGIVAPVVANMEGYTPEMIVMAVACGGTALSHVNDSGFWIVNQYLGMTVPQTLKTWSVMKMIVSITGFAVVMLAQALFF